MAENQHIYAAIDLKSFYASVECVSRKLDTLTTNLVVADVTRSEKTICLAVSPSLKACGIPGRPRLFEVVQKVREVNRQRLADAVRAHKAVRGADGKWSFASSSFDAAALQKDLSLELGYIVAPPRMATYIEYSTRIYQIYLKYVAPEDIHVYSIDEVFIDLTHYLPFYRMTAHELVTTMIREILYTTGITATAGIGTNLYLAKAAMDIVAKHVPADKDGVRIAELDEQTYRQTLWGHTPLTDFWRVGRGYERRLQKLGLNTMGDIALCSCGGPREYYNEDLLYKTFGVNAELLIDHAWGWEPTTIADIKAYKPESSSLGSGQVLTAAYPYEKARLVVREMAEELILNLVDKGLVTDQIDLTIGYDTASLTTPGIRYTGPVTTDHYGRKVPKHAHGTRHLGRRTQSAKVILDAAMALFDRIVNPALLVRRVNIVALHILVGQEELPVPEVEQLDLFTDYAKLEQERLAEQARLERESRIQQAALSIKRKFGKNALVKGMDLQEDATAMTRNNQIGGHKACGDAMNHFHRYDEIIHLPHPVSQTHPRMGRLERAAQFSPFAALTGYDDAVRETARLTDAQRELAEDEQALLERQLLRVQMLLDAGTPPVVAVTWFQPDAKKQGGAYVTAKGKVRKIDEFGGALLLVGGEKIPISAVIGIQLYNDKEQIEEG